MIIDTLKNFLKEEQWTRATIEKYNENEFKEIDIFIEKIKSSSPEELDEAYKLIKGFVSHNPRTIVGLYILGNLAYFLGKKDDYDSFIRLIEIFKENRKINIADFLLKKILSYDKNNIYALKLIITLYQQESGDKKEERIKYMEDLVRADANDGDTPFKLGKYYEEKAKNEKDLNLKKEYEIKSIMYYKASLRRFAKSSSPKINDIWNILSYELLEIEKEPKDTKKDKKLEINFFLNIASIIAENNKDMAITILTELLGLYYQEGINAEETLKDLFINRAISLAKKILEMDPANRKARDKIIEIYKEKYKNINNIDKYIENSGLNEKKIDIITAIRRFEKEIQFMTSNYVYHRSWGIGKILKIEEDCFIIMFDDKKEHKMTYSMALKSLIPLPDNHIWVLKKENKIPKIVWDNVEEEENINKNVAEVIRSVVLSFPDRNITLEDFKIELLPVISSQITKNITKDSLWNNWWNKAKSIIKSDKLIGCIKEGRLSYFLRETEISNEDELITAFNENKVFMDKFKVFDEFYKEKYYADYPDNFKDMVSYFYNIAHDQRFYTYERLLSYAVLRIVSRDKDVDWAISSQINFDTKILNDLDKVVETLEMTYRNEYRKEILRLIGDYLIENKEDYFIEILKRDPAKIVDLVIDEIKNIYKNLDQVAVNEKIEDFVIEMLTTSFKYNPYLNFWAVRYFLEKELYKKREISLESIYLELLYRMDTLAKLSLQKKLGWFTIPVSQNNVKDLIKFGDNILFSNKKLNFKDFILQNDIINNKEYIEKIYRLLRDLMEYESKDRKKIIEELKIKYPDLEKRTTEEEIILINYLDEKIIWTTTEGLEKQKNKLKMLKTEKEKLAEELQKARDKGDLRENAEYQAAREKERNINSEITQLEEKINRSKLLDLSSIKGDKVIPGTKVVIEKNGKKEEYKILGFWDTDETKNIIAYNAPIAKAILGLKKGETVEALIGGEKISIKVIDIEPVKI